MSESDYSVTVGGLPCTGLDISEDGTAITCPPPQSVSIAGMLDLVVNVSMLAMLKIVNSYIGKLFC